MPSLYTQSSPELVRGSVVVHVKPSYSAIESGFDGSFANVPRAEMLLIPDPQRFDSDTARPLGTTRHPCPLETATPSSPEAMVLVPSLQNQLTPIGTESPGSTRVPIKRSDRPGRRGMKRIPARTAPAW